MKRFTLIELVAVIISIGVLMAIILPVVIEKNQHRGKAREARCKSYLKQIGTAVASYYINYDSQQLPIKSGKKILLTDFDTLDISYIKCKETEIPYTWLAEGMYTGSENDTLAGDSVSHKAGHRLTVFQDGHVERFNWEKK